jgi:cytoskeleton protein RodZ
VPAAPATAAAGAAAIKAPGQTAPSDARSELIAVKDVWVRATVDGERVVERELAAGARVPLRGRAITIRAGNAGAVRIVIDGQDRGLLGAEGVVVTRTFTASAVR